MSYTITSVSQVEDRAALAALLLEFYTVIVRKYLALLDARPPDGAPRYTPEELMASF